MKLRWVEITSLDTGTHTRIATWPSFAGRHLLDARGAYLFELRPISTTSHTVERWNGL